MTLLQDIVEEASNENEALIDVGALLDYDDDGFSCPLFESSAGGKRNVQHVSSIAQRVRCIEWMEKEAAATTDECIASRCVKQFPSVFRGAYKANIQKASRWWKERLTIKKSGGCKVNC